MDGTVEPEQQWAVGGSGDFDDDGRIDLRDLPLLPQCFGGPASGACAAADMDSDARVTLIDYELFRRVFGRPSCPE